MRKMFLIILLVSLCFNLCFSILKPKSDNVGAIVGRIYLETDKDWETMKAGKYYKVKVNLINKKTNKETFVLSNKDGYYYFLNLEPGEYILKSYRYKYQSGSWIFTLSANFGKNGIDLKVDPKQINAMKTIHFNVNIGGDQKMEREENLDELKDFFTSLDKNGTWSDFKWKYEGNGKKKK